MQIFIMRFFLYATKLQWETMFFFFNGKKTCNLIFKLRLYFFSLYVKTKQYKKKKLSFPSTQHYLRKTMVTKTKN